MIIQMTPETADDIAEYSHDTSLLSFADGKIWMKSPLYLFNTFLAAETSQMKDRLRRSARSLTLLSKNYTLSCRYLLVLVHNAHIHSLKPQPSHIASDVSFVRYEEDGALVDHELFGETPESGVVKVTTIIGRLNRQGRQGDAVRLFSRMLSVNIKPNEFTFGTVIHSSTALGDLSLGTQVHASAMRIGLHSIVFVGSSVMDMYAKLGSIEEAQKAFQEIQKPNVVTYTTLMHGYLKKQRIEDALKLFREMPERNVVSWNAMIGGFSQMGHNEEAVNLFVEMRREGLIPSRSTFPCALSATANIAAIGMGRSIHACAVKFFGDLGLFVGNALISFYAKCGNMKDSLLVFEGLPERNIVSWNAVIFGFAQNGRVQDAINFFERMRGTSLRPNSVTFLGLLWACNHAGLVDKGFSYFNQASIEYPEVLTPEHYACMVDLLSRCGKFKEAQEFLGNLPFYPGVGFWKALLGGCQIHSNMEMGKLAAKKILELDPEDVSSYIMLSNAYSLAGRWEDVSVLRKYMREKGMMRVSGCSWIEIGSKVHVFTSRYCSHHQKDDIYFALKFCFRHMKENDASSFLTD